MNWFEAVVLGFIQGLTEFLPISSSAHLRIFGELLGGIDPGAAFTAITQIGTELAVIVYFRKDIANILRAWFRSVGRKGVTWKERLMPAEDQNGRMGTWIILGTIPIVVLGLAFQDTIETHLRNLYLVALMLGLFAIILSFADIRGRKTRQLNDLTLKHAVLYGLAQAMALVPGVSRSGGTITAGLLLGYTREAAARYSFLLAIPAVMGSGFYQLAKSIDAFGEAGVPGIGATALATLVAFVVGYVVIIWFLKIVSTRSYQPFVIYRIVLAIVIVVLLGFGILHPYGGGSL